MVDFDLYCFFACASLFAAMLFRFAFDRCHLGDDNEFLYSVAGSCLFGIALWFTFMALKVLAGR